MGEEFKLYQQECVSVSAKLGRSHCQGDDSTETQTSSWRQAANIKYSCFVFQDDAEGLYCQEQINRSGSST